LLLLLLLLLLERATSLQPEAATGRLL
jgi:hypothetical protein